MNTAITRLRKLKGKRKVEGLAFQRYETEEEENSLLIEKEVALSKAINQLNKFDKALVLLYLEDKSYQEMAEIMGISETYVGVKINRSKKKLKELVNPHDDGAR